MPASGQTRPQGAGELPRRCRRTGRSPCPAEYTGTGILGRTGRTAGREPDRGHALPGVRQYPSPCPRPAAPYRAHAGAGGSCTAGCCRGGPAGTDCQRCRPERPCRCQRSKDLSPAGRRDPAAGALYRPGGHGAPHLCPDDQCSGRGNRRFADGTGRLCRTVPTGRS